MVCNETFLSRLWKSSGNDSCCARRARHFVESLSSSVVRWVNRRWSRFLRFALCVNLCIHATSLFKLSNDGRSLKMNLGWIERATNVTLCSRSSYGSSTWRASFVGKRGSSFSQFGPFHHNLPCCSYAGFIPRGVITARFSIPGTWFQIPFAMRCFISDTRFATKVFQRNGFAANQCRILLESDQKYGSISPF